jgi:hypothetical protein
MSVNRDTAASVTKKGLGVGNSEYRRGDENFVVDVGLTGTPPGKSLGTLSGKPQERKSTSFEAKTANMRSRLFLQFG